MTFVYIVRCRFTEPAREAEWNAWYSGPKIVQMLSQPYFLSCQRFRRSAGIGRNYLALWTVQRAEALTTPQYRSQWGFAEWAPYITDWSRDLFDGGNAPAEAFAVAPSGALHVVSFDGMTAAEANAAKAGAPADMMWLPVAGLDRHTPMIGLKPRPGSAPPPRAGAGAQAAVYEPMFEVQTSR
jgi:hypothetical protein